MDAALFIGVLPVILAVLRGLRGITKHYKDGNLEFGWPRFIGSIVLFFIIASIVNFGLVFGGLDPTTMSNMIVTLFTSTGMAWGFTDVIEDVVRKG